MKVLIDLCCKAGGCTKGYQKAGFYVIGVDIEPQPHYCGDEFYQDDMFHFLNTYDLSSVDAIHASPPCQGHTSLKYVTGKTYPDLIPETRTKLTQIGKPWVIENVERAPLIDPVILCGTMFGLKVFRHRKFESSFYMLQPGHVAHAKQGAHVGRCGHKDIDPSGFMSVAGHFSNVSYAREAMGIDWMNQGELAQAIPWVYTEFIGRQLMQYLEGEH